MKRNMVQENVGSLAAVIPPLTSVAAFCRDMDKTPVTAWRWIQKKWLDKPQNIAGKPYFSRETLEKFYARAAAGEFARAPHVPRREKGTGV